MTRSPHTQVVFDAIDALPDFGSGAPIITAEQSPHAGLQAILPALATLSPQKAPKPTFERRGEAKFFLDHFALGDEVAVVPLWHIEHHDLHASEIVGWTYARHLC
ncbi:hypothetical protein FRC98_15180 [Lujinxingia vulgaris]|uniref:Uncharacterized protein n=1 Tax=Lujinxingia vulgaris TaxID=2600176 RepID=A0A5C6X9X8_9DELT|nr:hypothetical protein [Lujinxingia vulgaris]TXD35553.1 hypothetical protein FRC98_15180 [Lujinxingia vulgaris]